ncbi:PREDICTED: homocysteine-responsive endoplasmic reticulum-resident ubiquitin-like domain member 1 protein isoform X2 [Nanorana parkeri]|uniref:homocysteine-responsive endoplasmic reticulum-resident ubiquitin-like domain member 1 protein isoform X2 n=1 Tax=Nanorana parkeri TaxID=125878 RepID=UPI0008550BD6|nr:PREDICTED: homocysteine-responsive endoplasmic reticulum-resident ubiquitin-like domain member 1 protein isoform X2 [Nanorana parkeri]
MADGEVTLVIRSPSLKQEEREVKALRGYTVLELKSQLRRELPGHPMEQDQRLIYSGKLLPDHLKLNEVLSKENRHVLHLVFSMRSSLPSQAAECKPQPSTTTQPADPQTDGIRQRNLSPNLPSAHANTPSPPAVNQAFSTYSMYSPQQILWLQQMYARQYYMQYYAAAAATTAPSQRRQELPVVPPAAPDPLPHAFPAANQAPIPEVQAPVNPVANQNLRMNAQGGLVEEEDEVNRDWLDWVYTAARFSIFLSILYFYSSLSRFMMVLGAMILMYLHTAGWFPFRQRHPQDAAPAQPQVAGNQQDQNNNLQENGQAGEEALNEAAAATLEAHSFVSTAWLFFKTFFASLIPEGPPAMVQ